MSIEVILLEKIKNLGGLGDFVKVAPGFARNYLLPQQKAVLANTQNVALFESKKAELEQKEQARIAAAQQQANALKNIALTFNVRSAEDGKLFGSIGATEILTALQEQGHTIDRSEVILPEGPFKYLGDYDVSLNLQHGDATATIKIKIVPEA